MAKLIYSLNVQNHEKILFRPTNISVLIMRCQVYTNLFNNDNEIDSSSSVLFTCENILHNEKVKKKIVLKNLCHVGSK